MSIHQFAISAGTHSRGMPRAARGVLRSVVRACAPAVLVLSVALGSFSAAGGAETPVVGVAGSDSTTVLTRQVAELQMRVNKLERALLDVQRSLKKADTPDDDGGSDKPDKKGAGGKDANGSGGSAGSGSAGGGKPDSTSSGGGTDDALKDVLPTMTLRAPFVVVDSSGKTIFRVNDPSARGGKSAGERGIYVYGAAGVANFALTTVFEGGKLVAQSDTADYIATFGAVSTDAGLRVRKGKNLRTIVGMDARGKGYVGISTGDDDTITAGLQATDGGKAMVAVFHSNKPVAFLTESGAHPGGGNVTTTDPGGNGVFSAGYAGEGGEACVNRKQSTHCLGVGLPLGGGQ